MVIELKNFQVKHDIYTLVMYLSMTPFGPEYIILFSFLKVAPHMIELHLENRNFPIFL